MQVRRLTKSVGTLLPGLIGLFALIWTGCSKRPEEPAYLPARSTAAEKRADKASAREGEAQRTQAQKTQKGTPAKAAAARPSTIPAPPDVAGPPSNAERSASGLAWRVLRAGTGTEHPEATSRVEVHYTGWRAEDGQMFDSSVVRGQPAQFPLNGVIRGWTEGVALMVEGEKRRFWIPEGLAYGGRPGPPSGMLVFDVELLRIL